MPNVILKITVFNLSRSQVPRPTLDIVLGSVIELLYPIEAHFSQLYT